MADCVLEFIQSQVDYCVVVKPFIYDLIVHLLYESGSFMELHQLVQFEIIPDSLTLVDALTSSGDCKSDNYKLAIEVLKRLECHHDVLLLLIDAGKLIDAISYAQQTDTLKYITPLPFLESALQSGDKTMFLNVYRCFEEHGLLPLGTQVDDASGLGSNGIARYISVFREIWGSQIEMEVL
jgi:hypothetical protein